MQMQSAEETTREPTYMTDSGTTAPEHVDMQQCMSQAFLRQHVYEQAVNASKFALSIAPSHHRESVACDAQSILCTPLVVYVLACGCSLKNFIMQLLLSKEYDVRHGLEFSRVCI